MTAPMIVTNWINLQYYASVTDNQHYGSGNKMLHNVVGGNFGVFEGNGGDLRIGLPHQSLHDGETWRHQPLRLNVYIDAPRNAINNIILKHSMVKDLIENQWLCLFQWDTDSNTIWRYNKGAWDKVKVTKSEALNRFIEIDGTTIKVAQKKIEVYGKPVQVDDYSKVVIDKSNQKPMFS